MLEKDWADIIARGERAVMIAQVAPHAVKFLGASSDKLYLDPVYARKAAGKHKLTPDLFNLIWTTVEHGTAFSDRPHHLTFYYNHDGRWFDVTIKCAEDTKKLFLATFHRENARKVRNHLKRYGAIPK